MREWYNVVLTPFKFMALGCVATLFGSCASSTELANYTATVPLRSTSSVAPPPHPGAWVYKDTPQQGQPTREITRIAIRGVRSDGLIRLLWSETAGEVKLDNSTWWGPKTGRFLQQSTISNPDTTKKTCVQNPFVQEIKLPIKDKLRWSSTVKCDGVKATYNFEVVKAEKLKVLAGEFDTFEIVAKREGKTLSHRWYSPELRMDVRYDDTSDSRELVQLPSI